MPGTEIELDPVDFVTVGTVGPKGRRVFYLQAGKGDQLATLIMEKQQAKSLSEAVVELLDSLNEKYPALPESEVNLSRWNMALRDPLEPIFRVSQLGLGYDEDRNMVILVAQELLLVDEDAETEPEPGVVRIWATREQMRALSDHALTITQKGRADPKSNGYMIYYWT